LAIHKAYGERALKSYPLLNPLKLQMMRRTPWGPKFVPILDRIQYKSVEAIATLEKEFDWQFYGGKHHESVFTKFYQTYVLPTKFGVDKRRVHFSAKIRNGEMTRDEALAQLELPLYQDSQLKQDREYVLDKLQFTEDEFSALMVATACPHTAFPSDVKRIKNMSRFFDNIGLKQKLV
jgi:hypothetical protein